MHVDIGYVDCSYNLLSSIDISRLANLKKLYCQNNFITTLQIHITPWYNSGFGNEINCSNNSLILLDLQNNKNEGVIDFSNNPNLKHMCQDANQITSIKDLVTQYGYTNCIVDS